VLYIGRTWVTCRRYNQGPWPTRFEVLKVADSRTVQSMDIAHRLWSEDVLRATHCQTAGDRRKVGSRLIRGGWALPANLPIRARGLTTLGTGQTRRLILPHEALGLHIARTAQAPLPSIHGEGTLTPIKGRQ
jgi:hypothetical protein